MRQLPWKSKVTVLYGKYIRRMIDNDRRRRFSRFNAPFRFFPALLRFKSALTA